MTGSPRKIPLINLLRFSTAKALETSARDRVKMPQEDGLHSYHEVRVIKGLKSKEQAEALNAFIGEHVQDFQGETQQGYAITEEHFRTPKVVFSSQEMAHSFAGKIAAQIGIPTENIVIKAKTIVKRN